MIPHVDNLLATWDLRNLGVVNRRILTIIIYNIILERARRHLKDAEFRRTEKKRQMSVTIPIELSDQVDKLSLSNMSRSLWMGAKTNIMAESLRHLLAEHDMKYAFWLSIFRVTTEDIRRYALEHSEEIRNARIQEQLTRSSEKKHSESGSSRKN